MARSAPSGPRDAFPNPWRSLMRASAMVGALGLSLSAAAFVLPGSRVGLLVPGIASSVAAAGAWLFARARARLIEPELQRLRRGEAVAQWEMDADQWTAFARGRRARARAWVLGGAAGLSVLPLLLIGVLLLGPAEAHAAAGWIGGGLGGLWVVAAVLAVLVTRRQAASRPVAFTAKLCALGGSIYAWPNGIANISLDEENRVVLITRKGGAWMQARTFVIPVPEASFEEARGLLP